MQLKTEYSNFQFPQRLIVDMQLYQECRIKEFYANSIECTRIRMVVQELSEIDFKTLIKCYRDILQNIFSSGLFV